MNSIQKVRVNSLLFHSERLFEAAASVTREAPDMPMLEPLKDAVSRYQAARTKWAESQPQ